MKDQSRLFDALISLNRSLRPIAGQVQFMMRHSGLIMEQGLPTLDNYLVGLKAAISMIERIPDENRSS